MSADATPKPAPGEGDIHLLPLHTATGWQRESAAQLLARAFAGTPSAIELTAAREELAQTRGPGRCGFLALRGDDVLGFIGAIVHTHTMWELHPLVVDEAHRGQGVGAALVRRLEAEARLEGACMVWLGTDDDFGGTNLHGQELYPQVLERLAQLAPAKGHPFRFYEKLGYTVVGVLPDAGGPGNHDILMAKRLGPAPASLNPAMERNPHEQ